MLSPFSPSGSDENDEKEEEDADDDDQVSNKIVIDLAPKITFFFWRKTYRILTFVRARV